MAIHTVEHPMVKTQMKYPTVKPPLGKVQMKVLEYLAKNPNSLIQPTGTNLYIHDYKTIRNAFLTLNKKGYIIKGEKVKTKMGVTYEGFKLTPSGVAFLFVYSSNDNAIQRATVNYEDFLTPGMKGIYSSIEKELNDLVIMRKLLGLLGNSYMLYGEMTLDRAVSAGVVSKGLFSTEEVRRLRRIVPKIPALKADLSATRDNLDDILAGKFES